MPSELIAEKCSAEGSRRGPGTHRGLAVSLDSEKKAKLFRIHVSFLCTLLPSASGLFSVTGVEVVALQAGSRAPAFQLPTSSAAFLASSLSSPSAS